MKTTRKTVYNGHGDGYGGGSTSSLEYASFHEGRKVHGYVDGKYVKGVCTGDQRGDIYFAEKPEAEILLKNGKKIWIECDNFANY